MDAHGHSAAERHKQWPVPPKELVKWKDVLTGDFKGPDPILIRSRGAFCVFPQEEESPIWIPERLTRRVLPEQNAALHAFDEPVLHDDSSRTELGDSVGVSKTNAHSPLCKTISFLFGTNKTFDVPYLP